MRPGSLSQLVLLLLTFLPDAAVRAAPPLPRAAGAVSDTLGVNIHFTEPRPGEMKMLADAGVQWVRMDFGWGATEREKGKYDFSAYDHLMRALDEHHIRPVFILDYSNHLYDDDLSPHTDQGRAGFAKWAAAAATHFKGRGVVWEMYNEPNIAQFWRPKPDVGDYAKLAIAVGKALRQAAPDELYVGPATSTMDFKFLEGCFKAGCLEYWSAVSVHPYRQSDPETVIPDYRRLRELIVKHAPKGKSIPILSGEWGFSSGWKNFDEEKQGRFLPRQWLTNIANEIPISIWYDWHDDGNDPKEPEHHFGTVRHDEHAGRDPIYDPKPAYQAARTLTRLVGGSSFSKRLAVGGEGDFVLLFRRGDGVRLAAWTTSAKGAEVTIPSSRGTFHATDHLGKELPALSAGDGGLKVKLTDAPQYLVPDGPNDLLRLAAAAPRVPLEVHLQPGKGARIRYPVHNTLNVPVRLRANGVTSGEIDPGGFTFLTATTDVPRADAPIPWRIEWELVGAGTVAQETQIVVEPG